jgi:uncharacterized protein with HEPN domain
VSRRSWQDRQWDILDAAAEIRSFTNGMDLATFSADARTVKAVLADFAVTGEAARHLPPDVVAAHPEVPWRAMADMRNVVVHAYFSVEPAILWETIQHDLPSLTAAIERILG